MIKLPENYLGADLFWWHDRTDLNTLVTIYPGFYDLENVEMRLTFFLFDLHGEHHAQWECTVNNDQFVVIDSAAAHQNYYSPECRVEEGLLAVFVSTREIPPNKLKDGYARLFSILDWYSEGGELCTLHNDQSLVTQSKTIEFTEIVFCETHEERNFLVILNGPEAQKPESIELEIRNHRGEVRTAPYPPKLAPFSVNKLYMDSLFPGIIDFCDGKHVTLSGKFDAIGLFTRPYVITQGKHLSAYHGGNRYHWTSQPAVVYNFLGEGEINPVMALHNDDVTTTINLLNSHGDLEEDFWVDARLYDEEGKIVGKRKHWLLARRHGLSRGAITDLLPADTERFTGHIVLNFSADDKPSYPGRLQALTEYETSINTSRVMVWSDCWNSQQRQHRMVKNKIIYRGFFRVWYHGSIRSVISITNSGIGENYDRVATFRLSLKKQHGEGLTYDGEIPPQGTFYRPIESVFPNIEKFLKNSPVALVLVESSYDLAKVQITIHGKSGIHSAEHFMPAVSHFNGKPYYPTGS